MENMKILFRFPNVEMTAQEYLDFAKHILLSIKKFDPEFLNIYSHGFTRKSGRYLKEDLSDFHERVLKQIGEKGVYINSDPDDIKISLLSKSYTHFMSSYTLERKNDEELTVGVSCGSIYKNDFIGVIVIKLSESMQNNIRFDYILSLFSSLIAEVKPAYASVETYEFDRTVQLDGKDEDDDDDDWKQNIEIGWITYLAKPEIIKLIPDTIDCKQTENGVIFWFDEDKVFSDNADAVQKAIQIRNILEEHDLLCKKRYFHD